MAKYNELPGYSPWTAMGVAAMLDKYGFFFFTCEDLTLILEELEDRFGMHPGLDESRCRDGYYYLTKERKQLI